MRMSRLPSTNFTIADPGFVVNRSLFLIGARFELGRTGFFPTGRASSLTRDNNLPLSQWSIFTSAP